MPSVMRPIFSNFKFEEFAQIAVSVVVVMVRITIRIRENLE